VSGILCVHDASGIAPDLQRYRDALARLRHRGPDGEGHELRPALFLGVRRSSIERGTGRQPVVAGDGSIIVALDGHIHNRDEIAHALIAKGCRTDLSSDAALILAAYAEYGRACFEKLRGVWALVVWDERAGRLLIGRDPLGVRPLYYYRGRGGLVVASEIKSILELDDEARAIDHRRLRAIIHEGAIDDWSTTCFARVRPVPPGTVLAFEGDRIATDRYWTLRPATDAIRSPADVLERLVGAVERHTPVDVSVGLALSGGIDSASLAGIVAAPSMAATRRVRAFSVTPPKTPDESFLIDATIRHTGLPHAYESLAGLDYADTVARLVEAHDEPIQYAGELYQFALRRRMAEAGCRAVLVGYGADEIFGGYSHLAPAFLTALIAHGRWKEAVRFVGGARHFLGEPPASIVAGALRHAAARARAALLRPVLGTRAHAAYRHRREEEDVLIAGTDGDGFEPSPAAGGFDLPRVDPGWIFFEALLRCFRKNLAMLVRTEDRNAMAHGLDLCVPFMDEELVRAALGLPFHRYLEAGRNKAVLRDATAGLLAPEVRRYPKKLATPGNNAHVAFDVLGPALLELFESEDFHRSGLWSRRCADLYRADAPRKRRASLWFRVYVAHQWYERVVRRPG
jgi:asparagine synthase (glutamine-hydrolysing)